MKTVKFTIDGMTCAHCGQSVHKVLSALTGVKEVSVNWQEKYAEVTFDDTQNLLTALQEAIEEAGFDVLNTQQI